MSREFTMGIRLNYHDNDFTRGIREATRQTNSFRDGMAAAARTASGFTSAIGAAAVAIGGMAAAKKGFDWLVGANADMEQYQNTLTVVMKSQEEAAKTLAWANKFAAQTPFEIPQIVEATTRMSAYGISAQKTMGIVGDMASVMGKDLMQAVEAVADAQTGELERLKEFGITKSMIQDQAKLLGSSPIDNKGSITDMKAFNAALFSLMEDRFKGGMEMQSKSFKGMVSNAKDFMGSLGRQLGQPLFERSKRQLESFLGTLNRLQSDGTIDRWVTQTQKAGAAVGRVFRTAYQVTVSAFRGIWAVASPIIDGIKRNWTTWGPIIETAGYALGVFAVALGGIKTALLGANVAMKLLSATMLTNPIGWIALGVGLLIGLFIKLNGGVAGTKKVLAGWFSQLKAWYASDGTQAWVQKAVAFFDTLAINAGKAFSWIVGQAKAYWPTVRATVVKVIETLVTAFQWLQAQAKAYWPAIQASIMGVWENIQAIVLPAVKNLLTTLLGAFRTIWSVALPLGQAIYGFFKAIMPTVVALAAGVAWVVMNVLWPAAMVIWRTLANIAAAVIPVVANIAASVMRAFTAVLNWAAVIWPAVQKIIGVAFTVIRFLWAALGPYIMAALSTIGSIVTGGFKVIMAVVQFIWTTISSIIQVAWAVISGIIQTALGILTGDWQMAWDGFKSIFEGVWDGITNFLGGVGKLFFDSGKAIIETLVSGIKSMAEAPVKAVKNILGSVRDFLPFSDAKKGPLSELTYSGGAIMTTLGDGVMKQAASLTKSVSSAFGNTGLSFSAAAAAPTFESSPRYDIPAQHVSPVAPASASSASSAPVINFGDINIQTSEGTDTVALAHEVINQLYSQAKDAARILSTGNKAALI